MSSHFVPIRHELFLSVLRVIALSRITYKKMMQNLVWATAYNVIAIPAAVGAFVSFQTLTLVQKSPVTSAPSRGPIRPSASTLWSPVVCKGTAWKRAWVANRKDWKSARLPAVPRADKNVRGSRSNVTVSKGCQQDNGKYFRSDISVLFGVLPRSL